MIDEMFEKMIQSVVDQSQTFLDESIAKKDMTNSFAQTQIVSKAVGDLKFFLKNNLIHNIEDQINALAEKINMID